MLERIGRYLLDRFREASTWRGLILVVTAAGVAIQPQMAEAIIAFGLALAGGTGMATPDRLRADPPPGDRVPPGGDPAPDDECRSPFLDHE